MYIYIYIYTYIYIYVAIMWVKQCHLHHPPVTTVFIGAMVAIQSWVVYDIVLPRNHTKMVDEPKKIGGLQSWGEPKWLEG